MTRASIIALKEALRNFAVEGVPASGGHDPVKDEIRDGFDLLEDDLDSLFDPSSINVYVNASTGSDTTGNGTSGSPFKTIQKAYDSLPRIVEKQCVIWLAPGVHDQNYLFGDSDKSLYPRNAVLFARGRMTGSRTQNNSGLMSGPVVIKSNGGNRTDTFIETSALLDYGVYLEGPGQLAIQDVTLRGGGTTTALAVSHRGGAYLHMYDVPLDANGETVSYGAYAEAGGGIEFTGTNHSVDGCTTGIDSIIGSVVDVSGSPAFSNCGVALRVDDGAAMTVNLTAGSGHTTVIDNTNTLAVSSKMGVLEFRSTSNSNHILIDAPVETYGTQVTCVYADFLKTIKSYGGEWRMDSAHFDQQWTVYDTEIYLRNANSYAINSGTSKSSSVQPMRVVSGSKPYMEGSCTLIGSGNGIPQFAMVDADWIVTANGTTLDPDPNIDIYRLRGDSASYTGCDISAVNAWEGRVIHVAADTSNTVTLTSSTTLGLNADLEMGAESTAGVSRFQSFMFVNGKWHGGMG